MLDQAIRKLGRTLDDAIQKATGLLTCAEDVEIERAIRTLQLIKGKTYAKALLKENGKILNEISFDIGISLMLLKHRITKAELELWYDEAERKKFEGHIFQPLPDKADAWALFQNVRNKLSPLSFAAQELFESRNKALQPPMANRITRSAAKTALELGMWRLLTTEQKREVFSQLEWGELPRQLKLEFFDMLPSEAKQEIINLPDILAREKATCDEYGRLKSIQESASPQQSDALAKTGE